MRVGDEDVAGGGCGSEGESLQRRGGPGAGRRVAVLGLSVGLEVGEGVGGEWRVEAATAGRLGFFLDELLRCGPVVHFGAYKDEEASPPRKTGRA